jgi:hypothetical protein
MSFPGPTASFWLRSHQPLGRVRRAAAPHLASDGGGRIQPEGKETKVQSEALEPLQAPMKGVFVSRGVALLRRRDLPFFPHHNRPLRPPLLLTLVVPYITKMDTVFSRV